MFQCMSVSRVDRDGRMEHDGGSIRKNEEIVRFRRGHDETVRQGEILVRSQNKRHLQLKERRWTEKSSEFLILDQTLKSGWIVIGQLSTILLVIFVLD